MNKHIIDINKNKCIGCSACVKDCPSKNIMMKDNKACIYIQECLMCGHCVAICPESAISISGFEDQPIEYQNANAIDNDELLAALRNRRSIRSFKETLVADEVIDKIIEAGRFTPTAKNLQNVSYVVLKKEINEVERMAVNFFRKLFPVAKLFMKSAKNQMIDDHFFFKKAPLVILVVSNGSFANINGGLAASNMALMAETNQLGVLYSGFFTMAIKHSSRLRKKLNLSRHDKVIETLVIGYPNVKYYRSVQKEKAVVHYEKKMSV